MSDGQWFNDEIAPTTLAIVDVRDRFERWLEERSIDRDVRQDLTVVLSELCANAVSAAKGEHARIQVRAWLEGGVMVVEVENARASNGGGVVFRNESDPLRGHGQGLMIVTAYTDSVEVIPPQDDSGLVVRCRKDLADGAGR